MSAFIRSRALVDIHIKLLSLFLICGGCANSEMMLTYSSQSFKT